MHTNALINPFGKYLLSAYCVSALVGCWKPPNEWIPSRFLDSWSSQWPADSLGENKSEEERFLTCGNHLNFTFQCPEIKFYCDRPHLLLYVLPLADFAPWWQSWVAVMDMVQAGKPKIVALWPFTEKVGCHLKCSTCLVQFPSPPLPSLSALHLAFQGVCLFVRNS